MVYNFFRQGYKNGKQISAHIEHAFTHKSLTDITGNFICESYLYILPDQTGCQAKKM